MVSYLLVLVEIRDTSTVVKVYDVHSRNPCSIPGRDAMSRKASSVVSLMLDAISHFFPNLGGRMV